MWSDDELRNEVQRRHRAQYPAADTADTFRLLLPQFHRARRRRRAAVAASTAVLLVGGTAAVASVLPGRSDDTIVSMSSATSPVDVGSSVTDPPAGTTSTPDPATGAGHDPGADDPTTATSPSATTTSVPAAATTGTTVNSAVEPTVGSTVGPAETSPTTQAPAASPWVPATSAAPDPATSTVPTTSAPATTVARRTEQIVTRCGDVDVVFGDGEVSVSSTDPAPGYTAAVHDDGHREIEVTFSSDVDEDCDVHFQADGSIEISESGT